MTAPRPIVVDCDTHFWQPAESWIDRVADRQRAAVQAFMDQWSSSVSGLGKKLQLEKYQAIRGGDDPAARLEWMDAQGLDVNVIYPGAGLVATLSDGRAAAAACRALNEWSAEFASRAPARLKPAMLLPVRHPDHAVEELQHARALGLSIAFCPPTPARERCWSDPSLDPFWSALQETGTVLTFHEISRIPKDGGEVVARASYAHSYPFMYFCGHIVEMQLALMDVIGGGVLQRFPRLRVGFVEANVAWLPGWLASMDSLWGWLSSDKRQPKGTPGLELSATGFFRRQCFIDAFPDDAWIEQCIEYVGEDCIVLCTDYPHPGATPKLRHTFESRYPGLPDTTRRKLLGGNAARIFGLAA